jgi:hypothetical protein
MEIDEHPFHPQIPLRIDESKHHRRSIRSKWNNDDKNLMKTQSSSKDFAQPFPFPL